MSMFSGLTFKYYYKMDKFFKIKFFVINKGNKFLCFLEADFMGSFFVGRIYVAANNSVAPPSVSQSN